VGRGKGRRLNGGLEEKFSLWLVPGGGAFDTLDALIQSLCDKLDAPRFGPHLTLLGGIRGTREQISKAASSLASSFGKPFDVTLTRLDYKDEYYRCLFIEAEKTSLLMAAHVKAVEFFGENISSSLSPAEFEPHVSLLYGEYPTPLKEEIITQIGEGFPKRFTAEGLSLYKTEGGPTLWKHVGDFPFR